MRALLLAGVILTACGPSAIPHATAGDVARAQARWPDSSEQQLNQGRRAYLVHCGGCHSAVPPARFGASAWQGYVERMAGKAKLADPDKDLVIRYLQIAARPDSAAEAH